MLESMGLNFVLVVACWGSKREREEPIVRKPLLIRRGVRVCVRDNQSQA